MEHMTTPQMERPQTDQMDSGLMSQLLFCAGVSLFWVVFVWNFWTSGVYALGINASIFLALLFALFICALRKNGAYTSRELVWILPIALVIASFTLYDNPFLKTIHVLVLPVLFVVFYNQAFLANHTARYWDFEFLKYIVLRFISVLGQLHKTLVLCARMLVPAEKTARNIAVRIAVGILALVAVLLLVVIPLLSSADAAFSLMMQVINDWVQDILAITAVYRILTFVALTVVFFSAVGGMGPAWRLRRKRRAIAVY